MAQMELRNGRIVGLNGPLPVERRPAFEDGVSAVFTRWTALCLAVENEWGGPHSVDKANQLIQDVLDWFYGRKEHAVDDLEAELGAALAEDFNVECEDGSPRQVAATLVELHSQCLQGDTALLDELRRQAAASAAASGAAKSKRQVVDLDGAEMDGSGGDSSSDDDDDDDDSGMDEDDDGGAAPAAVPLEQRQPKARPEPVVDEDGFELVQGRRGRGGGRR